MTWSCADSGLGRKLLADSFAIYARVLEAIYSELPFGGFLQPNRPNIPLQAGKPHYAKVLDQAG